MGTSAPKSGNGVSIGSFSESDLVHVGMTAGAAKELLQSLTLKQPLTGPSANRLLTGLSRALLASSSASVGKGKSKSKGAL
jgi:hypothetical protein